MSDSGEGQRLGQGSSLRGSPSALTGAGLALQEGDRGSASGYTDSLGRSLRSDVGMDKLPAYGSLDTGDDFVSEGPLMAGMSVMQWDNGAAGRGAQDPAEDEGIDMDEFEAAGAAPQSTVDDVTNVMSANWNFQGLVSRARSEADLDFDDLASDRAQNDSSDGGRASSLAGADDGLDSMLEDTQEPGVDYTLPDQPLPQSPPYELPPAPGFDQQEHMNEIAEGVWNSKVYKVPADVGNDAASDTVEEIHLGDEEFGKSSA